MNAVKYALILVAVLIVPAVPAAAQKPARANETLLAATSPFEDMGEFALVGDDENINRSLGAADRQQKAVQAALLAERSEYFAGLLKEIHKAAAEKEHQVLAKAGVMAFRLLVDEVDPGNLTVPKKVNLLDCAGFSLMVAAADFPLDWKAMRQTAAEVGAWWKTLEPRVADFALRDAFSDAVAGMTEATRTENLSMLTLAYKMDLDLVDLLEHHFEP